MQFAAARRQQTAQHAKRGGLAGAVGAEQAEDLAAVHLEVDVIDRGEGAEFLHQLPHPHRGLTPALRERVCDGDAFRCARDRRGPAAAS